MPFCSRSRRGCSCVRRLQCRSAIETEGKIDSLLADLKLVAEQHVILRDLRLDQKMIIRIAIEVLTKSSLVVLNDPFISFTPSMTMNVLNYLKKAQRSGVIILLYFTQPRSMVLKFIQNVLLFGPQANILYSGTISNAERYFSQFELPNRHDYSDSDYLLDIVSPPGSSHSQISRADDIQMERIISAFRNSEE